MPGLDPILYVSRVRAEWLPCGQKAPKSSPLQGPGQDSQTMAILLSVLEGLYGILKKQDYEGGSLQQGRSIFLVPLSVKQYNFKFL